MRVGTHGFVEAINRHAVEVVDNGFMQLFSAAAHAGKLLLLLLWALSSSMLVLPPLVIVVVAMLLRMYARERNATLLRLKSFKTYDMVRGRALPNRRPRRATPHAPAPPRRRAAQVMMHAENVTSNFELARRRRAPRSPRRASAQPSPPPPHPPPLPPPAALLGRCVTFASEPTRRCGWTV